MLLLSFRSLISIHFKASNVFFDTFLVISRFNYFRGSTLVPDVSVWWLARLPRIRDVLGSALGLQADSPAFSQLQDRRTLRFLS